MKIEKSSGNIYQDLGFKNPVEAQCKAYIIMQITSLIDETFLTRKQSAAMLDISLQNYIDLTDGLVEDFTQKELLSYLKIVYELRY